MAGVGARQLGAVPGDGAAGWSVESAEAIEKGGFSGTAGTDEGDHLPGLRGQAKISPQVSRPERFGQILCLEQ